LSNFFNGAVSSSHSIASKSRMVHKYTNVREKEKNVEGSGRGVIKFFTMIQKPYTLRYTTLGKTPLDE